MSIITITENWEGKFKKTSFESLSYGRHIANQMNSKLIAITIGGNNLESLIQYGADKIINITNFNFENNNNTDIAKVFSKIIEEENGSTIIISNTNIGKKISPLIAQNINAGLITNAVAYPEKNNLLKVKCKAFSSKSFVVYESDYNKNIISIIPNSIGEINQITGKGEILNQESEIKSNQDYQILKRSKQNDKISLSDANIVVSAGRGLKGPENWPMIEELAELLGAATACSKPVSDMGWRPHSEHVGQTGIAVNPDLYIAIGISGAIQHLAGVNASKNIVVINTDAEAPFFKAANYGIIGDAFTVIPKLIEAIKQHKN
ncbi:MAG: electron transfer flavoprotein subunit alpha [Flavobacteriales bacterium]|nr:electron transfer flavoprotein subunit alpha [Flavobacteriales bacterium]|tara:strand:+ start:8230 stop:9189 length:960 start_codon:yes stop_codon:yes gene_type:complete